MALFIVPGALLSFHFGANLVGVDHFSTLGRGVALFDHSCDFRAALQEPFFLLVEHPDGPFHELIGRFVKAALHVSLNQGFDLRAYVNGHIYGGLGTKGRLQTGLQDTILPDGLLPGVDELLDVIVETLDLLGLILWIKLAVGTDRVPVLVQLHLGFGLRHQSLRSHAYILYGLTAR